jgi:spermidine synthase
MSGLIYQILWTRMIIKIIGGAPFAVSIILTVFMAGLGSGAYVAGKYIDRIKETDRLLKIYGLLELAIGIYASAIPLLLKGLLPLYGILYNQLYHHYIIYNLLTFLIVFVVLCFPVICMGATLPVLCRFYVSSLSHLGADAGRLYGLNTIGAAFGALLCGFWLIEFMGITWTLVFAVMINTLIGLACLLISRKLLISQTFPEEKTSVDISGKPSKKTSFQRESFRNTLQYNVKSDAEAFSSSLILNGALVIFAVSGFCAMAYEVIWTKLLGLIVGPTTYSFTIVLVTFILGLGLGSIVFGWITDRVKEPVWLLIVTQVVSASFVLIVSQLLGNSQFFFAKLIFSFQNHFTLLNLTKAAVLFLFMILPTLCLGGTFPLVGKIYTQSVSTVGKSLGFAYMINTAGAVLGAFCAGFLLIPFIGKENGLSLVIGFQFLTSLLVALLILVKNREGVLQKTFPIAVALAGLILCFYLPVWNRHGLSQGKYHRFDSYKTVLQNCGWGKSLLSGSDIINQLISGELVYYGDGIGGFTTVTKHATALGRVDYTLSNSGKADASSFGDMPTQILSAHFPMLLHPNPKTVMVLGLASGITAGEVLNYRVDKLDILEISHEVVVASDFFRIWNNNALSDPRTKMIIQDGRAHLQLTNQKYDVIISEPSNPWMAGLATLFTYDFFSLAKNRLNDDGVFAQFIHGYQMDWPTFSLIGRTFAQAFPGNLLVTANLGTDYLMIGFKGKNHTQALAHADQKMEYIRKFKNVNLSDPKLLYMFIVSEDMQKLFGNGRINSDASPRLEYMAPKVMYAEDPMIYKNILANAWVNPETERIFDQISKNIDQQINFFAYAISVHMNVNNVVCPVGATGLQKKRFLNLIEKYCADNIIKEPFSSVEANQRCILTQIEKIKSNIDRTTDKSISYKFLADLYQAKGALDDSIIYYSKSLHINPDNPLTHEGLAASFCQRGMIEKCIAEYREALRLMPDLRTSLNNLSWVLATTRDEKNRNGVEAVKLAEQACTHTDYENSFSLDTLAAAYAAAGRYTDAVRTAQKALLLLPESEQQSKLASEIHDRMLLYKSGRIYITPLPRKAIY